MAQRIAVLLVWFGLIALCAGVWVLAGYGWALVVSGLAVMAFGLVAIDVDKPKGEQST